MAKVQVDRYVKIIRRSDNNGGHTYRTVLFSESPYDNERFRTHKQFNLDYESGSRPTAELFAHKLATCLECRVVQ
jgi:hypothetical protein